MKNIRNQVNKIDVKYYKKIINQLNKIDVKYYKKIIKTSQLHGRIYKKCIETNWIKLKNYYNFIIGINQKTDSMTAANAATHEDTILQMGVSNKEIQDLQDA